MTLYAMRVAGACRNRPGARSKEHDDCRWNAEKPDRGGTDKTETPKEKRGHDPGGLLREQYWQRCDHYGQQKCSIRGSTACIDGRPLGVSLAIMDAGVPSDNATTT